MPATPSAQPSWWRRWFGSRSERSAARYLRKQGFRIIARNWTTPQGELDIVAVDEGCIVFVEVRSTAGDDTERPASSVDIVKQKRLTRMALQYLQAKNLLGRNARFDVLAISWPPDKQDPVIEHIRDAFEPTDRFQLYS
ncbi:MAG TPA: YraN family protein [Gemmataceae bacterium]|jgi:putative endonuclease|nr:YraN family protein [Gemmataceae bacterium]